MPTIDDTTYTTGRTWTTSFDDQAADAIWADITNLTYTTDGPTPVARPTDPATPATIFTKAGDIAETEVLVKWRPIASSPYTAGDIFCETFVRKTGSGDYWLNQVNFGVPRMQSFVKSAGSDSVGTSTFTDLHSDDTTTYRLTRTKVLQDVALTKTWFDGDTEPDDWQNVNRFRAPIGISGATSSEDNPETGVAGVQLLFGGAIAEMTITELARTDDNLLWFPLPSIIDSNNIPVGWYPDVLASPDTGNVDLIMDSLGDTRNVFHIVKSSTDRSLMWTQWMWASAPNAFLTRYFPHPKVTWPPTPLETVRVSVWSKGLDLATPGILCAVIDMYMYDDIGTVLNFGWPDYYGTLGPDGGPVGAGPTPGHGVGTWDWTFNEWTMDLPIGITSMKFQIGFHDEGATGELWFADARLAIAAENIPPTAAYTAAVTEAVQVEFDATGSVDEGYIQLYTWDFGDGEIGSGATPTHLYETPGTYAVVLTVTDNRGASDVITENVHAVCSGSFPTGSLVRSRRSIGGSIPHG